MDHVLLTFDPLEINKINDLVTDDACGAISYFVGTTRDNFESKKVLSLEYEAYEPMALKEMNAICKELRVRWPDIVNIAIYHRLGLVKVREASVIIAISSPHRQTALDATTSAIEELKRRVPIWKKEKYCNDESAWKENKECAWISPGARNSKRQLDFSTIKCPANIKRNATDLVQISAPESEIERRIDSFVKKKREEIDLSNALDFVSKSSSEEKLEDRTSCARTDSVLIKQEQSGKGHLRVRHAARADCGPQTRRPDYLQAIDKHMTTSKVKDETGKNLNFAISNERIHNIESFLGLPTSNPQSVLQRLKTIENRILFLETVSPEYKHFLNGFTNELSNATHEKNVSEDVKPFSTLSYRKSYSIAQMDAIISEYEEEKP